MPSSIAHRTLASAVAQKLRDSIIKGDFPDGFALRQNDLAASFGVSRIPLREAFLQLEAEGLLRIEPHKGAVVSGFDQTEVDDVFELRLLIEPRLLRAAIPNMRESDFQALETLDTSFAESIKGGESASWGSLNAQFHLALYAPAQRPRSLSVVAALLQSSNRYTRIQMNRKTTVARAQHEHAELMALCRARKLAAACAYLTKHIEAVHRDLSKLLQTPATQKATRPANIL